MKARVLALMSISVLGAACSWIKPSVGSHSVALATQQEVSGCANKGLTTSKTLSKFFFIPRGKDKMYSELVMLAKNEAVIMEGDTIVPEPVSVPGTQAFAVYACKPH